MFRRLALLAILGLVVFPLAACGSPEEQRARELAEELCAVIVKGRADDAMEAVDEYALIVRNEYGVNHGLDASELSYDELVEWQVESLLPLGAAIDSVSSDRANQLRRFPADFGTLQLLGLPEHHRYLRVGLGNALAGDRDLLIGIIRDSGRACVCAPDTPFVSVTEAE